MGAQLGELTGIELDDGTVVGIKALLMRDNAGGLIRCYAPIRSGGMPVMMPGSGRWEPEPRDVGNIAEEAPGERPLDLARPPASRGRKPSGRNARPADNRRRDAEQRRADRQKAADEEAERREADARRSQDAIDAAAAAADAATEHEAKDKEPAT